MIKKPIADHLNRPLSINVFGRDETLDVANQLFILEQQQVSIENIGMLPAKTFSGLLSYGENLTTCQTNCSAKTLAFRRHISGGYLPLVHTPGAVVHSEHLPDDDAF